MFGQSFWGFCPYDVLFHDERELCIWPYLSLYDVPLIIHQCFPEHCFDHGLLGAHTLELRERPTRVARRRRRTRQSNARSDHYGAIRSELG